MTACPLIVESIPVALSFPHPSPPTSTPQRPPPSFPVILFISLTSAPPPPPPPPPRTHTLSPSNVHSVAISFLVFIYFSICLTNILIHSTLFPSLNSTLPLNKHCFIYFFVLLFCCRCCFRIHNISCANHKPRRV